MSDGKLNVIKVTLPTSRIAYLKEIKIKDTHMAAKMIRKTANQAEMGLTLQTELLKILLVRIDEDAVTEGPVLDHKQKNDLDNIMSMAEYNCLMKVIGKMGEDDSSGELPDMEMTKL